MHALNLIGGCGFTTEGLRRVLGALGGTGLRRLHLSSCSRTGAEVTAEVGAALAGSLRRGGALLEDLSMACCEMGPQAAEAVTGALSELAAAGTLALRSLCMSDNEDMADGAWRLVCSVFAASCCGWLCSLRRDACRLRQEVRSNPHTAHLYRASGMLLAAVAPALHQPLIVASSPSSRWARRRAAACPLGAFQSELPARLT